MEIRRLKATDIQRVHEIIYGAISDSKKTTKNDRTYLYNKYSEKNLIKLIKESPFFVVTLKGTIIGMGRLSKREIATIYFDKKFRGRGGGTIIVRYLEKIAKKKKIAKVYVKSLLQSTKFYEHIGYSKHKRLKRPINSFKMEKDL